MNPHETLETLVRETLEAEPSPADREAAWRSIRARLREGDAPSRAARLGLVRRRPHGARLPRAAAVGVALAVVAATVAPLPTSDEPGRPVPTASTAEAAAILDAAATSTRSALPPAAPGTYLLARTRLSVGGEGAATVVTTSWTATDGSATIVERQRSSRPCPGQATLCPVSTTATTRYAAGSDVGVRTENGRKAVVRPELFAWRATVAGDEVVRLPAERDALLASLRAHAARAVAEHRERPDPHRALGGSDMRLDHVELSGLDLVVLEAITGMLVDAPLSPDQRAALLSLLADAPGWYRPGTSAVPMQIRNLGPTTDALGRTGTAVRIASQPTDDEARRAGGWLVDLVLDVEAGRLLETRSYEHGPHAPPIPLTVEAQRVVDSPGE